MTARAIGCLSDYRDVDEMARVLAYAEMRSIMLAWARTPFREPISLVKAAVDQSMPNGPTPWGASAVSFGGHCCRVIERETTLLIRAAARTSGLPPWQLPIAPGQVGDVDGLDAIFHASGKVAGDLRAGDPRIQSLAFMLTDYVRASASTAR